jgi:hypothetical protein
VGLDSVLIDRARISRKRASDVKVGGRTTFGETEPGTWFAARLQLPTATPEQVPSGFVSKRVVFVPTLIFATEDDEDNPIDVHSTDTLEVESEDLGNALWQVTAEPQPFRKREGIIGYQVPLKRVETSDFQPRSL